MRRNLFLVIVRFAISRRKEKHPDCYHIGPMISSSFHYIFKTSAVQTCSFSKSSFTDITNHNCITVQTVHSVQLRMTCSCNSIKTIPMLELCVYI